jgi:hypothetical protein
VRQRGRPWPGRGAISIGNPARATCSAGGTRRPRSVLARRPSLSSPLAENSTMPPRRTTPFRSLVKPAHRAFIATSVAASLCLVTPASQGQAGQGPGASGPVSANAQQNPAPIDPRTVSCSDLKGRLQSAGQLTILSGPRGGWGDTFYGPKVPRCQFWQMPVFQYVGASDGLCGVGYICVDKLSFD